jgi:predicted 3-demethylubiquinone-9 3-methyltransferase (glyoxalase superfamily)
MRGITPCLWFDDQAEQAVEFYGTVFDDVTVLEVTRYGPGAPRPAGTVLTIRFEMAGQRFLALNGGPEYRFTEAVSFMIDCADQHEVDRYWDRLSEGGEEGPCGWLKDRFGLSWQVVPRVLPELLASADAGVAQRVLAAMMTMGKLDVAALKQAADGG